MRVVIDTNVFVSGLFFGGIPRQILNLIEGKSITLCFTIETFTELKLLLNDDKFTKQRNLLSFSITDFLNNLEKYSLIFPTIKIPLAIKIDISDNFFLACALVSGADFIVSGDQHLLKLKTFHNISILTPRQFLNHFRKAK